MCPESVPTITQMKQLEEILLQEPESPSEPRGLFVNEAHCLSYFEGYPSREKKLGILEETKMKNSKQGVRKKCFGSVTLSTLAYCPECLEIFSAKKLQAYYRKPYVPQGYDLGQIMRKDTRVHCSDCDSFFMTTLIIETDTPQSEVQYLCRVQTIDFIENRCPQPVLSQKSDNRVFSKGEPSSFLGVRLDVSLDEIANDRVLLANFLQYTPFEQCLKLLAGQSDDLLIFGGAE